MKHNTKLSERLLSKMTFSTTGCWGWIAYKDKRGYGKIMTGGTVKLAHRMMYELFYGRIGKKLTIDHLCRNRSCVNPLHLDAVTQRENVLRGVGLAALNAKKTHCPDGHEYTKENVYVEKLKRKRHCKSCRAKHAKHQRTI